MSKKNCRGGKSKNEDKNIIKRRWKQRKVEEKGKWAKEAYERMKIKWKILSERKDVKKKDTKAKINAKSIWREREEIKNKKKKWCIRSEN